MITHSCLTPSQAGNERHWWRWWPKSESWGLQGCHLTAHRECYRRAEQRPERARRRCKVSCALATTLLAAKVLSFPTEHGALNARSEVRVVWLLILKCCSLNLPHFLMPAPLSRMISPSSLPDKLSLTHNANSSENHPRLHPELWRAVWTLTTLHCDYSLAH